MKPKTKTRPQRLQSKNRLYSFFPLLLLLVAGLTTPLIFSNQHDKEVEVIVKTTAEDDVVILPMPIRNISRGEKLGDVEFTTSKWPKSQISSEFITSIAEYRNSIAITVLPKHLPIPKSALSLNQPDSNAVVEGIPEAMRAITVRVDAESAVEGWARSGSFVDVIVIRAAPDANLGLESKVIAENVKILSAGRSAKPSDSGQTVAQPPTTATLLVSQEDALKIKTAANIGKLTFALRGSGDNAPTLALSMNQKRLLGEAKTIETKKTTIKGYAQGPDGKRYVLTDKSEWLSQPVTIKDNDV